MPMMKLQEKKKERRQQRKAVSKSMWKNMDDASKGKK
eukprot:CAMPEP_0197523866 /NCGR_PEP_ID=MMETSP1318-20131121/8708_1 /TAXON_ID=552666 /ORGANISM="Partenskyella glossopodia, Strain RCC365" /LENGTH=36 /DNA_ID= /DNA_START= /DNA_END= /DNA_ORIENTATION=